MNNFLLFKKEKIDDQLYEVRDHFRLEHLHQILKSSHGDMINLCLVDESLAIGKITELKEDLVQIEIQKAFQGEISPYYLLIGLSRPPTCKKLLEHATSLGAAHFHFFKAELSEKSYLDSKIFKNDKHRDLMNLGLSQSKIYFQSPSFKLSSYFPKEFPINSQKFFLSLTSEDMWEQEKLDFSNPIFLAIGPERGWTEKEEEDLIQKGFKPIKISSSTLRVEIATFVALGQLELLRKKNLS